MLYNSALLFPSTYLVYDVHIHAQASRLKRIRLIVVVIFRLVQPCQIGGSGLLHVPLRLNSDALLADECSAQVVEFVELAAHVLQQQGLSGDAVFVG